MESSYGYWYTLFYDGDTYAEIWTDHPLTEKKLIKHLRECYKDFDESILKNIIVEVRMLFPSYKKMGR